MSELVLYTSWGSIRVTVKDSAITDCRLAELMQKPDWPFKWLDAERHADCKQHEVLLKGAQKFIKRTFEGKADRCNLLLASPVSTVFQREVWNTLTTIPLGNVVTYGQLARMIGRPQAARAIGQACGANPLPLFVPCHRVVGAHHKLGGFSSGTPWKELLLEREGSR